MRIAINGFGRIGRVVYRLLATRKDIEVVAINNPYDGASSAHLLRYDSVHGKFNQKVIWDEKYLSAGTQKSLMTQEMEPTKLPWKDLGVDLVLECSGVFLTREKAGGHLAAGAKRILLSAPPKDKDIPTLVYSVNHEKYDPKENIVSNGSCTTNCLAPVLRVIIDNFGFDGAMFNTVHSYTNDQRLLDFFHKDMRRARAACHSMIPTSTGAAKSAARVIPEIEGKINGLAIRVPTPNVSLVDLNVRVKKKITVQAANDALKAASESARYKNIIDYTNEELVSSDFNGSPASATIDALSTMTSGENDLKVIAWYDNEVGFSARMIDMAQYILSKAR